MNTDDTITDSVSLPFSKEKQAAVLGHLLTDTDFFVRAVDKIKPHFFADPYHQKILQQAVAFQDRHSRAPLLHEVMHCRDFETEDAPTRKKLQATATTALDESKRFGLDAVKVELDEWMRAQLFQQAVRQSASLYNARKPEEAYQVARDAFLKMESTTFDAGNGQGLMSSDERFAGEEEERAAEAASQLSYGVTFLDNALGGIKPTDLVILTAPTGKGKTQLATAIALHNSRKGKRVAFFALEAEHREIERRILYSILANLYYSQTPKGQGKLISYSAWRDNKLVDVLKPFEAEAMAEAKRQTASLKTLYRTSGTFDYRALERQLAEAVKWADLIVLDHLHFLDVGDKDNENAAYKRVVVMLRDFALRNRVPVLCLAHIRKAPAQQRKNMPLLSSSDDIHGSSDITKLATVVLICGWASDQATEPLVNPSYIQIAKNRRNGSVTRYVALCFYSIVTNSYFLPYRLGYLSKGDTEWVELSGLDAKQPEWSKAERKDLTEADIDYLRKTEG